jgi:hypothetical protein
MTTDGGPFCSADDANVLDGKNCKEQVLVGAVVPILIHCARVSNVQSWAAWCRDTCVLTVMLRVELRIEKIAKRWELLLDWEKVGREKDVGDLAALSNGTNLKVGAGQTTKRGDFTGPSVTQSSRLTARQRLTEGALRWLD